MLSKKNSELLNFLLFQMQEIQEDGSVEEMKSNSMLTKSIMETLEEPRFNTFADSNYDSINNHC